MSQRLHIGKTVDEVYDIIVESLADAKVKLTAGLTQGPLKIRIADLGLYGQIEPILVDLFEECGESYPESVAGFYFGDKSIDHPDSKELVAMLGT